MRHETHLQTFQENSYNTSTGGFSAHGVLSIPFRCFKNVHNGWFASNVFSYEEPSMYLCDLPSAAPVVLLFRLKGPKIGAVHNML